MNENTPGSPDGRERQVASVASAGSEARAADPSATASAELNQRLLEARLRRMESFLGFRPLVETEVDAILAGRPAEIPAAPEATVAGGSLEEEIGEFWLARIGVFSLVIGLGFLVAYPFTSLPAALPSTLGFFAGGGLFWLSRRWQTSWPEVTRLLFWGSLFLLYFATLRLHFLATPPLLPSRELTLGLLVAVLAAEYILAVRRGSEATAVLVTSLGFVTAIASDSLPVALGLMLAVAGLSVWLLRRYEWQWHYGFTVLLVYLTHLLLLVGNPLAGHPIKGVAAAPSNLAYLGAYLVVLALAGFLPGVAAQSIWLRIGRPVVLTGGTALLVFLNIFLFHRGQPPWVELATAALFLAIAAAGWWHQASRYGTAVFSCAGYVMLSLFVLLYFPPPACYAWLAWQSLVVAATAVWFRSKIIVVANLFIFGGIYGFYLLFEAASGPVNLSFAAVALLTARLLNWQNERLELRTELMRNFYLGAATVAIPYGLLHTVPAGWVSASWLLAAGAYFGICLLLHNRKYRWMAIGTVFAAIVHVFIFDLARLTPAFRIMSFLLLGVVLLVISVFYARSRRQGKPAAT